MLLSQLKKQLAEHQLDSIGDMIIENATECYSMEITAREDYAKIGNTRFGGNPDLPKSYASPCDGGPRDPGCRFSNFIAQINFADLPPLHGASPLPRTGILYLFVRSMDGAAKPVLLDVHFFDGPMTALRRTPCPEAEQLCDEYLIDLVPQKIKAIPAMSFPFYRKDFRTMLETDRVFKWYELEPDLEDRKRVGQLLGYANAGDIRDNLYRQVVLDRLGKRELVYNDYWTSMQEYEADISEWKTKGEKDLLKNYESMRPGVTWLIKNREAISKHVAEWRMLFRLNSNTPMNLNINDADPLYVFIREDDLEALRFSNLAGEVTQG
jgi:uncharacterized protein YwqG